MLKIPYMKVGVVTKRSHSAKELAKCLKKWLEEKGYTVVDLEEAIPPFSLKLVIVIGGDGTLLHTARLLKGKEIPILGINMGGLGFLTETTVEDAKLTIERVLTGDVVTSSRMMCDVFLLRKDKMVLQESVLNDVVITKGKIARMIELEASVNGVEVSRYRADGLIVSTPTGSTAYVLSAGGPIISPDLDCMIICPICPHTLTNRPIVISPESEVLISILSEKDVYLTLDGQQAYPLRKNDKVLVKRSKKRTTLVTFKNFFDVLKNKLHWGER